MIMFRSIKPSSPCLEEIASAREIFEKKHGSSVKTKSKYDARGIDHSRLKARLASFHLRK